MGRLYCENQQSGRWSLWALEKTDVSDTDNMNQAKVICCEVYLKIE
jgi:hypothetical protein